MKAIAFRVFNMKLSKKRYMTAILSLKHKILFLPPYKPFKSPNAELDIFSIINQCVRNFHI